MDEHLNRTSVIEYVQDLLLDTQDVSDFLSELARYSAANLSSSRREVLCGITLLRKRSAATVASSGDRALLLDELQYEYGDGPCLRSCREGILVHVQDFRHEAMWPDVQQASKGLRLAVLLGQHSDTASNLKAAMVREVAAAIVRSAGAGPVETHFD